MACRGQRIERGTGFAHPKRRVAPAMDQLVGLGEEFDLADAAAPLLEIEARPRYARPRILRPDPRTQAPDLVDSSEIQTASPDKGADGIEKRLAACDIARSGACTDKGGAFPSERRAFVMAGRRLERYCQRADLGGRAQPQVDAEDVSFRCDIGQQSHDIAGIALRRLGRIVTLPAGQRLAIVEQNGIDVGAVVEFARAMLAQRQPDEARRLGIGDPAQDGRLDRPVQRAVGEGGQFTHDLVEWEGASEIADGQHQRQR